jgi:ABC-type polysaccharide/polyol phosphate export permease
MGAELRHTADYFYHIYRLRYFWLSLVRNDVQNRYRRSFLGIVWSLARPLGMTLVLSVVFTGMFASAFNIDPRTYPPFLFLGIALWQFLLEAMVTGCSAFKSGATYIRQQPVPLAIFPLRTVLGSAIHSGIALVVGIFFLWYFLGLPSMWAFLAVLPGLLIMFLLGVALATLLGIMHTHFPDTQHLLEIALQALFYLTPVMYPPEAFATRGRLTWLITWNPFTSVLGLIRGPLMYDFNKVGPEGNVLFSTDLFLFHLWYASLFLLLVAGVAWFCLRRFERDLVYWI